MSYTSQASRYREMEVLSASPGRLVVLLYDHLLVQLRRAALAMEQGDAERRAAALERASSAVQELMVTLDHEKGGEIAAQLSGLYGFLLGEFITLGRSRDTAHLGRLIGMVTELRDAFATITGSPVLVREVA
jgi:flagellar protein FliS